MQRKLTWLVSVSLGGCVAGVVLWVMSSMIGVESFNLQDQTNSSTAELIGTRHQCQEKLTELDLLRNSSRSCQTDEDCDLLIDGNLTFGQCFIPVRADKLELVAVELEELGWHCRDSYYSHCGHMFAYATCQGNTCSVEYIDRVGQSSLQELQEQTIKSIDEDFQAETDKDDS